MNGLRHLLLFAGIFAALASALLLYHRPGKPVPASLLNYPLRIDRSDPTRLRGQVEAFARELSERQLVLATPVGRWRYHASELGLEVAVAELEEAVLLELRGRRWAPGALGTALPARIDRVRLEQSLAPLARALELPARPALLRLEGDQPVIDPHEVGRVIVRDLLAEMLLEWFRAGGTAEALLVPIRDEVPKVTTESVREMGIRRLIAEATTEYDPNIPRAENVERAAVAFDGLVLKPGQILSYTGVVGPIRPEAGWKEAYVIVAGELVPGVGGGVCQVATTFYGAVLRAGFEVLERHPHQLAVPYVPASLDAAVAPGFEDLKVRNTTGGHVLVRTESVGGRVTVRLYGDLPQGLEIRVGSHVIARLPFETVVVRDPSLPRGARQVQSWGVEGHTAEAYRSFYMNGHLSRRELLSRDTYRPARQVELVGR